MASSFVSKTIKKDLMAINVRYVTKIRANVKDADVYRVYLDFTNKRAEKKVYEEAVKEFTKGLKAQRKYSDAKNEKRRIFAALNAVIEEAFRNKSFPIDLCRKVLVDVNWLDKVNEQRKRFMIYKQIPRPSPDEPHYIGERMYRLAVEAAGRNFIEQINYLTQDRRPAFDEQFSRDLNASLEEMKSRFNVTSTSDAMLVFIDELNAFGYTIAMHTTLVRYNIFTCNNNN